MKGKLGLLLNMVKLALMPALHDLAAWIMAGLVIAAVVHRKKQASQRAGAHWCGCLIRINQTGGFLKHQFRLQAQRYSCDKQLTALYFIGSPRKYREILRLD